MIDKYFFTAFIEESLQKYTIKPLKDKKKYDIKLFCSSFLPKILSTKNISLKTNDKGTYIIITDVLPLYLEYKNNWSLIHSKMLKVRCLGRKVESVVNISEVFILKSKLICRYKNTILNKKK
ncbi:hypothetical protein CWI38_0697p0040 [Hamiltosporidium tvaerminnensis]|uniref:Uncharacterized protein n=1 Tax=Hamiltosporidium tvaerminnensis TaxID=1176355 RepID=A0A4Q9LV99_9MICR|nr:hypothetical protein CWI38_0697p0040 [Hamiltosporidium tvaerminnensis]